MPSWHPHHWRSRYFAAGAGGSVLVVTWEEGVGDSAGAQTLARRPELPPPAACAGRRPSKSPRFISCCNLSLML